MQADLAREVLERTGQLRVRVRGGSMGPWLRTGDWVRVVPVRRAWVGEVLAFSHGGELVTHRVRARAPRGWILGGDANERDDGLVPDERVIGRVAGLHARWIHLERAPRPLTIVVGRVLGRLSRCYRPLRRAVPVT